MWHGRWEERRVDQVQGTGFGLCFWWFRGWVRRMVDLDSEGQGCRKERRAEGKWSHSPRKRVGRWKPFFLAPMHPRWCMQLPSVSLNISVDDALRYPCQPIMTLYLRVPLIICCWGEDGFSRVPDLTEGLLAGSLVAITRDPKAMAWQGGPPLYQCRWMDFYRADPCIDLSSWERKGFPSPFSTTVSESQLMLQSFPVSPVRDTFIPLEMRKDIFHTYTPLAWKSASRDVSSLRWFRIPPSPFITYITPHPVWVTFQLEMLTVPQVFSIYKRHGGVWFFLLLQSLD